MNEERFFSDQEAESILSEAARIDGVSQSHQSRQQLIAAAAELGISEHAVREAEQRVRDGRQLEVDRAEFLRHRNGKLLERIWSYLGTSIMLLGINYFTAGFKFTFPHMWSLWVIGIWGLCLGGEILQTLFGNPERQEVAFEKWRRKKTRKANPTRQPEVSALLDHYFTVHPSDDRFGAIRVVRESTGLGLSEAKSLVDDHCTTRGID